MEDIEDELARYAAETQQLGAEGHGSHGEDGEDGPERPTSAPPTLDITNGALFWMQQAASGGDSGTDGIAVPSSTGAGVSVLHGSDHHHPFLSSAGASLPPPASSQAQASTATSPGSSSLSASQSHLAAESEDTFEDNFASSYEPMDNRDPRKRTQSIEKFLAQSPGSILGPRKKYVENSSGVSRTATSHRGSGSSSSTNNANATSGDDAMQFINMESPGHALKGLRKRIDELDLNTDYQEYHLSGHHHQLQHQHQQHQHQQHQHVSSLFAPISESLSGASPVSPETNVQSGSVPPPLSLRHQRSAPEIDLSHRQSSLLHDTTSDVSHYDSAAANSAAAAAMYHYESGAGLASSNAALSPSAPSSSNSAAAQQQQSLHSDDQHMHHHQHQSGVPMYPLSYDQQQGMYVQDSYAGYGQQATSLYGSASSAYYNGGPSSSVLQQQQQQQKVMMNTMGMPMMSHSSHWGQVGSIPPPPPGPPPSDSGMHHNSMQHLGISQHHHQHHHHDPNSMLPASMMHAHPEAASGPGGHLNNGHGKGVDAGRGRGGRKGGSGPSGPGNRRGGGMIGGSKRGGRGGAQMGPGMMNGRIDTMGTPNLQAPLEEIRESIFQLSKEQLGCRFLQVKVDADGGRACQIILDEVRSRLVLLMLDPFGNYLFQKLLEKATVAQRGIMLQEVESHLIEAALNLHGTRSVQKFIEVTGGDSPTYEQLDVIVEALKPHVTRLSMDTNGNHVIQRCLQYIPHDRVGFVYETVIADVLVITRHRHGCCVFQRCLDAADDTQRAALVDKVIEHAIDLMQDPFSNYVVQYVLENAIGDEGDRIICQLRGRLVELSTQKFSSNVVEKCLAHASPTLLEPLIDELCERDVTRELLNDSYGNYVAQRALHVASDNQGLRLVAAFRPHMTNLATSNASCARRVSSRVVKRFPNLANDALFSSFLQREPKTVP